MAKRNADHEENTAAGKESKQDAVSADSAVADRVQDRVDRETEQGFRGVEVDQTPNEAYTLKGVTSDQPTPETNAEAAAKAERGRKQAEQKATGVAGA